MRLSVLSAAMFALMLPLHATPSHAGDYPFTGLFVDPEDEETAQTSVTRCALSFFDQRTDGKYAYYHLDLKYFRDQHQIRYVEYANGTCTYDRATRLEVCNSAVDLSDTTDQTYSIFNAIMNIESDRVSYVGFDSLEEAQAAISGGDLESYEGAGEYRRCVFDEATMRSHIVPGLSTVSEDEINAVTDPDTDMLKSQDAAEVVKMLKTK